ncbi:MAG TPA: hypothetical protein VFE51_03785 [Verrucomicrobiae bacterium]|nr:hypothetical protein [Verrucomicrobiae bacterium]
MHIQVETDLFNRPGLALPIPRRGAAANAPNRAPALSGAAALRLARREVLRAEATEHLVWLGLALVSLAVLVVSFLS